MAIKIKLADGREALFEMVDKTRPIADKDYECCWQIKPPHAIKKGQRYVRLVYKIDGDFQSDHICLECFTVKPEETQDA